MVRLLSQELPLMSMKILKLFFVFVGLFVYANSSWAQNPNFKSVAESPAIVLPKFFVESMVGLVVRPVFEPNQTGPIDQRKIKGLKVVSVMPSSSADRAGFVSGMVILEVNDCYLRGVLESDVERKLSMLPLANTVRFSVLDRPTSVSVSTITVKIKKDPVIAMAN